MSTTVDDSALSVSSIQFIKVKNVILQRRFISNVYYCRLNCSGVLLTIYKGKERLLL